jgi:cell wall-associated NlpC family hydrolase
MQANRGVAVDWFTQDIRAGDLIFMATTDAPGVIGHVGIAIDSTRWIHSPRAGDVVRQGFIPADSRLLAVRRYVNG